MSAEVFDFFPLSVFKDKIILSNSEKNLIKKFIIDSEEKSKKVIKRKGDAWLGDTRGQEFLLKNNIMNNLTNLISQKIKLYTEMLSLDNDKLIFFYQRSWATITKTNERIQPHSHDQSNISFAYYLTKPKNSGNIRFITEPQNEIAKGLFHKEKLDLGLLKKVNKRNTPNIDLHIEEDNIVIFPSKTKHATIPSTSNDTRISISGDVIIMLKDSFGHERLMPHFDNWQEF
ncbi:MAG: hypothetical protein CFH18_00701 [Alphaproteobacteria bacterium MarineAlpha5_Bin8]|nr:MAG: hypothetical protein CFH17_00307 [Alphaproteobacteria bacterium MarineAlpha5_Bin7]PPR46247.1 MAG: hypothetical protein CFH18_00701 [Alphaproteobacteria bacterium MarineAlpha5_Bin8]PPR53408.1 MAG: hypothetical protein CFH16_01031 [Alphaproteobacteria bacterium MarineAlpha5_Bin6]|tara:strand:+ start:381 stop:1070 length:690 start_codon:yes stop_codon:yes gene_type:complete